MFEKASRLKLRFNTSKGLFSAEDLWDLDLKSLNALFKVMNKEAKASEEDSLMETKSRKDKELELRIDIVKHIFSTKKAEAEAKANRAEKKAEKDKLLSILASKEEEDLLGLDADELKAKIAALDEE